MPENPPGQQLPQYLRRRFWSALRGLANDPNPERRIGSRLGEALQVLFDGEGAALEEEGSGTYVGIRPSSLKRVMSRLKGTDPKLAARLSDPNRPGGPVSQPYQLTPQEWALVLRNDLNIEMGRAGGGGVQAVETIGNSAPGRGSRELAVAVVALMLSSYPTVHILNREINNLIQGLPPAIRDRLPQRALATDHTTPFRRETVDAIVTLSQLGYAEALRAAIVRNIPAPGDQEQYMVQRRRWLGRLRFVH